MGYTSSTKTWGTDQLLWNALHLDNSALVLNDGNTLPIVMMTGGMYNSGGVTYGDGDAALMQFTSDGKLMVDTELTIDGNVIIDNVAVWATDIADSSTTSFALVDAAGHPQVDVLTMPGGLVGYAEDTQHTTGDIGIMPLSVRQDTGSALGTPLAGTEGDYQPLVTNELGFLVNRPADIAEFDEAVSAFGNQLMVEAKNFDDSALPNSVAEGDAVRPAASLSGIQYTMPVSEDGSKTPLVTDDSAQVATPEFINVGGEYRSGAPTVYTDGDATIFQTNLNGYLMIDGVGSQNQTVGASSIVQGAEGKDFDGSALPNTVTEGNATRVAATLSGVQYVMVVNEDGSARPAYDSGTDSFKQFEVSPLSSHHVEETLADVTNETNATTYYYVDLDGYKFFSLQIEIGAATDTCTVTIEATNQDDGTAAASCVYQDVTNDLFGVASVTADDFWVAKDAMMFKYIRVKTVTAGGNNDADYTLYHKKGY